MWTASANDLSLKHRTASTTITVTAPDGAPVGDADIHVEQVNHDFLFGNIGFDFLDYATGEDTSDETALLAKQYLDLYNGATLPFYFGKFEPERGKPDTARLMAAARWFDDHGVTVKGHPLVWHTSQPQWLNTLPLDEVESVLRARIRREVGGFAGTIDMWDAINEVVIMPVFTAEENAVTKLAYQKGRIEMVRMAFEEAKQTNPNVYLLLNDFDLSSAYECLIEGCLEAGIPIDAIGLQTHMHQGYRGDEELLDKVEKFSRYGLPIHMTESSLVSGHLMPADIVDLNDYQIPSWPSTPDGEERQADEMRSLYTCLVSHPAVQAIVYWGITDRGAWLGAPIGLVRADGTPKPSYDVLKGLIKGQWWIGPCDGRTDPEGRFVLNGWRGTYDVTVGGQTQQIHLDSDEDRSIHLG